jgi:nitrous oxide reductase accessory protein NosL
MYAITLNGYYYAGINCLGAMNYSSSEVKRFKSREEAEQINATIGGQIILLPSWNW